MRVIYFTSAMEPSDFARMLEGSEGNANPSGQNFHAKLIRSFTYVSDVEVVSFLPLKTKNVPEDKGYWHYVPHYGHYKRYRVGKKIGRKLIDGDKDAVVVYDALSLTATRAAYHAANAHDTKRVAILTDNPDNLSGASSFYPNACRTYAYGADGYISLSVDLLNSFEAESCPHKLVFEGLVDEDMEIHPVDEEKGTYIYFGGALYERYGVKDLYQAYLRSGLKEKLVIAGHGPLEKEIAALADKDGRVRFLGQLSEARNFDYEGNAALAVNPRRPDPSLDVESVPSKVIEYIAAGVPIVSTIHPKLQSYFPNDVMWLEEGGEESLYRFFESHRGKDGHLARLAPNNGKEKAVRMYGLRSISARLQSFLASLSAPSN
jgi:glycosyltransferase involved in cell wall biosynthesis